MSFDGILNVNKPAGWTSFDVVAFIRGRSRTKRVGHAGTLDPFAEGVLPVALGKATRLIEYLMDATKAYRATVRLGAETDTYDRTGTVIWGGDASAVSRGQVEVMLRQFEGEIEQRPPAYSAIKREGVPLYRLARAGQQVETEPRVVRIFSIKMTDWRPPLFDIEVECGKGTYIRSLAHDIGAVLGTGASLDALTRTRVGPFALPDALDIETLRAEFESETWTDRLLAIDEVLLEWPAAILGDDNQRRVRNGVAASFAELRASDGRARAYSTDGDFLAVLQKQSEGVWRPAKVL